MPPPYAPPFTAAMMGLDVVDRLESEAKPSVLRMMSCWSASAPPLACLLFQLGNRETSRSMKKYTCKHN